MRMRKKKNGPARMQACADYLLDSGQMEQACEGKELRIEIGCGKGTFLLESAEREPDVFFVGIERVFGAALLAAEKLREAQTPNACVMLGDVMSLSENFPAHRVSRIYLNFSDPWPKARHAKRRLTYRTFLAEYKKLLAPDGAILFKTDNVQLFEFSLQEFEESGFLLRNRTDDLHASKWEADNIHTEYEDNFSAKGFSIHRVEAYLD